MHVKKYKLIILLLLVNVNLYLAQTTYDQIIATHYTEANAAALDSLLDIINNDDSLDSYSKDYYLGFINNFLGSFYLNRDEELAESYLEQSIEHLDAALKIKPNDEIYALLASSHGRMIKFVSIFSKMSRGNIAQEMLDRGAEIDSMSIYIRFETATSLMYRPAIFGGDTDEAKLILFTLLNDAPRHVSSGIDWVNEAAVYYKLIEIAKMEDDAAALKKFTDILKNKFPEFNLVR